MSEMSSHQCIDKSITRSDIQAATPEGRFNLMMV